MTLKEETFAEEKKYPLDNLSYDLVCLIYEKSKGLEALDSYLHDAEGDAGISALFHRVRQQEGEIIEELERHLADRLLTSKTAHSGLVTANGR